MAKEAGRSASGLTREEELLAQVVVDLGFAKSDDVKKAKASLVKSRKSGEGKSLSQVLKEKGCLSARFAAVVEKAVKSRIAARDAEAGGEGEPSGGKKRATPSATGMVADSRGSHDSTKRPDRPVIAEGAVYKQVPKGEGFARRSKSEVLRAWTAHKEGRDAEPAGPAESTRPAKPAEPEATAPEPEAGPPEPEPESPPAKTKRAARKRKTYLDSLRPKPSRPAPAEEEPAPAPKRSFVPKRRRIKTSGVTQEIDIDSIKSELGLEGGPQGEGDEATPAEAVPKDSEQKRIALRAFIHRAVRGRFHQHCLNLVLRRRLTILTAVRLAQESGLSAREAKRVLDDWKAGGIVTQGADEYDILQYHFTPSKADLELIREFMTLWNDGEWHNLLLGWMIEAESG